MPRPHVTSNMTTTGAARELGMSSQALLRRVKVGVLPEPTSIDKNGVRYFNEEWLEKARGILNKKKGNG